MPTARKRHQTDDPKPATTLTEKSIKQQVGERSFRLGQDYYNSDAVFDCRRQGTLFKARCTGQSAASYVLSARVEGDRINEANCSCPVGGGGSCKHMAAMLLTVAHAPDEFHETPPLETLLSGCSQSKLIELIGRMIEQEPDLESWLELAVQTVVPSKNAVKPDAYRRKAINAFESAGYEWGADRDVADSLEALRKFGDQFLEQKNFESAAAVYSGILEGFLDSYESHNDEEGDISEVAGECIEGLGNCFEQLVEGTTIRESAVKALFDMLRLDMNLGGTGLSDGVPDILVEQTTPAERALIAQWIREEIPTGSDFSDKWSRQYWGSLLLDFQGEPTDDEAFLQHCREFGLTSSAVDRLLKRGRLDDALKEIRASSDYELMGHADCLIKHKHSDLAHKLIQDRLLSQPKSNNRGQLRDWLKRYYETRKDWSSLLQLCVEDFDGNSTLQSYQEIRKLAQKLKSWESLRPGLIAKIPKASDTLIRIHLDEGDVESAIALLESRPKERRGWAFDWDRVDLEVAKAVEKSHPRTSLKIYRHEAERLIDARGRSSYESACGYLKKVRDLYKALDGTDDWDTYITAIREKYRALRALLEELTKARL